MATPSYMKNSHVRLLVALVLGAILGVLLHPQGELQWLQTVNTHLLQPIGQIFLRLIFMIVVPMIFSAIVLGVYELGQSHGFGRVAAKTLFYTIITSACSVLIGLSLVNIVKPGVGITVDQTIIGQQSTAVSTIQTHAASTKSISQVLVELIPKNPLDAAVRALDGEIVSFMVFALLFGLALSLLTRKEETHTLTKLLEDVFQACMKIVDFAMILAPFGVFALVFQTAFKFGISIFQSLFYYVLIVIAGLLIQQFVVYASLLKIFARRSPWTYFRDCRDVYLYAF